MPMPARKARRPPSTAAVRRTRAVSSPGVRVTNPAARVNAISASTVVNSNSFSCPLCDKSRQAEGLYHSYKPPSPQRTSYLERRGRFGPAFTVRSPEPDNLITSVSCPPLGRHLVGVELVGNPGEGHAVRPHRFHGPVTTESCQGPILISARVPRTGSRQRECN